MTLPLLVTDAQIASAAGVEVDDITDAQRELAAEVCGAIRDHLDQRVDRVDDDTVVLYGRGRSELLLPQLPVIDVTEVTVTLLGSSTTTTYVEGTHYRAELGPDGRRGVIRTISPAGWPIRAAVTVTYSHGFDLDASIEGATPIGSGDAGYPLPPAIVRVVRRSMGRALANPEGIRQESVGRHSVTYAGEPGNLLSSNDRSLLAPWRPGSRHGSK